MTHDQNDPRKNLIERRPTETVTGIAGAGVVYGFLTQSGVDTVLAAIVAVVVIFLPGAFSAIVDKLS